MLRACELASATCGTRITIPGGRDWAQDGLWSPALALPAPPQLVKTPLRTVPPVRLGQESRGLGVEREFVLVQEGCGDGEWPSGALQAKLLRRPASCPILAKAQRCRRAHRH